MKFKTNIKCSGCIATVTPVLNEVAGTGNWQVDLNHPDRILTLPEGDANLVKIKLKEVGYQAEKLEDQSE